MARNVPLCMKISEFLLPHYSPSIVPLDPKLRPTIFFLDYDLRKQIMHVNLKLRLHLRNTVK